MSRASIVIVDDDQLDRYLLTRDLRRGSVDAHILECSGGVAAVEFFEAYDANKALHGDEFPPQIILLDINMPCVSGFDFLKAFSELRTKHEAYADCSVMMVSSSEHPEEQERALGYEFVVDFVIKGRTSAEELSRKIETALGR
ncbi:MAG: CheY-like chemotaxis protein [Planctomycetota bacterium]|jgi:CheY-like chemotaxis protein